MSEFEFVRGPQWVSREAFAYWAPRIEVARQTWNELEAMSITSGIRSSMMTTMNPDDLVRATRDTAEQGLELTVLGRQEVGGYQASATPGTGNGFRVAIHRPGLAADWLNAWTLGSDEILGQLLGFPACCRQFFEKVWVEQRYKDTTLSMKRAEEEPALLNIMFRWLGVRMVPHLPCSFGCVESLEMARSFKGMALAAEMSNEVRCMEEILSLPVEYSTLNGVGMVTTPFFRFSFSSDFIAQEMTLSRDGTTPEIPSLIVEREEPFTLWADNGFSNRKAMTDAHLPIISVMKRLGTVESVADLGCGDGTLLSTIRALGLSRHFWGCDLDGGRITRGEARYPDLKLEVGRLEEIEWPPTDVILLMPGRLSELPDDVASRVRGVLALRQKSGATIVVYGYTDNLKEFPGNPGERLAHLVAKNGLPGVGPVTVSPMAEAAVLDRWEQ